MTRCYDFYAPILKKLWELKRADTKVKVKELKEEFKYCKDKCDRSFYFAVQYCKKLMEPPFNVIGSGSQGDRERFRQAVEALGSEKEATQGKLKQVTISRKAKVAPFTAEAICPNCNETLTAEVSPKEKGVKLRIYKIDSAADVEEDFLG